MIAPVTYCGFQPGYGHLPGQHLYTLTADIPGHCAKSTVSETTLRKAGYEIPVFCPCGAKASPSLPGVCSMCWTCANRDRRHEYSFAKPARRKELVAYFHHVALSRRPQPTVVYPLCH